MIPKLLAEAVGTGFLVLAIGLGGFYGDAFAPVAIGFTLMVMVYAGGHVSGAHYNPATTVAMWIRGRLPAGEIAPYMGAQFAGAFVAALLVYKFRGSVVWVGPGEGVSLIKVVVGEIAWTFALVYVILNVATAKATAGNSYYGLAIGGTVLAGAIVMGPVTGGAFNPAVGVAPALFAALIGHDVPPEWWTYLVAPPIGGAAAAYLFKWMNPGDV